MTDHSLALQSAIVALLKGNDIAGDRIYVLPNAASTFPYVSMGPADATEDDAECIDGVEATQQIDVWSRSGSNAEAMLIAGQIRRLIHRQDIPITAATIAEIEVRSVRLFRDPDGKTTHVVIEVRAIIETE
ncbi:DUF3168 domain-containing protein [Aureimonas glaciei]|uniref:DUF3168 domain-containing protein n=1 Tax=Aureimonas glaciei TaxID=1776957 RepID=A0A917DDC1_9HYPH|nr:DUF3168 domain-containing protein [Aureimonas glaciei]GGD30745.1 hypothetical protein GCM10011335_37250 [Aureimonas glaciei]